MICFLVLQAVIQATFFPLVGMLFVRTGDVLVLFQCLFTYYRTFY